MIATAQKSHASRLLKLAESLPDKIAHLRRDRLENTQKRQREGMAARLDAANLERLHRALVAMAEGETLGILPAEFAKLSRKEIEPAVTRQSDSSGGYYIVRESDKWRDDSPRARKLREWLGNRIDKDPAAAARDAIKDREEAIRFVKIPGFFPTPPQLVARMIEAAELGPGMKVLEPSAGKGDLCDAIKREGAEVAGFEIAPSLADLCKLKGHGIDCADFMQMPILAEADRVLMNPPFEKGQDCAHVRRAFEWLKPGGRLVAIVSAAAMQDRNAGFLAWVRTYGRIVENEDGAFSGRDAFRQTGVRTCLVVMDKPSETIDEDGACPNDPDGQHHVGCGCEDSDWDDDNDDDLLPERPAKPANRPACAGSWTATRWNAPAPAPPPTRTTPTTSTPDPDPSPSRALTGPGRLC